MLVAIYTRVSTDQQVDGTSLATQERDCRAYADRQGWHVVDVYTDEGLSGRKEDRPALQRLLVDARAKRITMVLVWKFDRFARNVQLQHQLANEFERIGVHIYSVTESADPSSTAGWVSMSTFAFTAELYSRMLSDRMQRALSHNIEQGLHNGPVPIGYQRGPDGVLTPTDDAPAVVAAFDLYATRRYTYDTLADALNAQGFTALDWRTGQRKPFSRESVRFLLKNKTYIGLVQHKGAWHPGQHQGIISQERFAACESIMEHRSSWRGVPIVHAPPRLLHGLVWCDDCRIDDDHAHKMWLHYSGNDGTTGYYRCAASRDHRCSQGKASAKRLEQTIVRYLEQLEAPPALRSRILEYAYKMAETPPPAVQKTAPTPEAIEQKRQKLTALWSRGLLPDHEYEQALVSLQGAQETPQPVTRPGLRVNPALLGALITDIPRMIREATADERRAIVQEVFDQVWIGEKMVKALTPTVDAYPLLASIASLRAEVGVMGWPMGLEPVFTPLPLPLRLPRKLAS